MLLACATVVTAPGFAQSALVPKAHGIRVDAGTGNPISPYIYGLNFWNEWISDSKTNDQHRRDGVTLLRAGGNRFTDYNWENNASNAGNDFHFENDAFFTASDVPGWWIEHFIRVANEEGAAAIVTVPMLGYVSADKDKNRNGSINVKQTPDYIHVRFERSYARKPGRHFVYPPNVRDHAVYQDEFVHWVETIKPPATPVWFSLDNEPDIWSGTHSEICPAPFTYADFFKRSVDYASAIKAVAPNSLVFGPVNYGWEGMRNFQDAKDSNGRFFVDAYLDAMRRASKAAKTRLLDVYDFHWYSEASGDGVRINNWSPTDKPGTAAVRIQAPRSLWDPTYIEPSWVINTTGGKPIRLLPMMKEKIAANFPGTRLAITEYDYGGRQWISGALAEADALGIFGRYGLFAACHWGLNDGDHAAMAAFRSFTDFDHAGSHFGDLELKVAGETPAENSVYAARDSKDRHRLTLVVINKLASPQKLAITLNRFKAVTARGFVVKDGTFDDPAHADVRLTPAGLVLQAAPLSITTVEVRNDSQKHPTHSAHGVGQ
jgi:hypothetical protein